MPKIFTKWHNPLRMIFIPPPGVSDLHPLLHSKHPLLPAVVTMPDWLLSWGLCTCLGTLRSLCPLGKASNFLKCQLLSESHLRLTTLHKIAKCFPVLAFWSPLTLFCFPPGTQSPSNMSHNYYWDFYCFQHSDWNVSSTKPRLLVLLTVAHRIASGRHVQS